MRTFVEKLKARWEVESNWQVAVIFFIFAITGMSSVYIKKPVFELLGLSWDKNWITYLLAYIFIFFPLYQLLFLTYGYIFGQFAFVWRFEKKMLGRIFPFIK